MISYSSQILIFFLYQSESTIGHIQYQYIGAYGEKNFKTQVTNIFILYIKYNFFIIFTSWHKTFHSTVVWKCTLKTCMVLYHYTTIATFWTTPFFDGRWWWQYNTEGRPRPPINKMRIILKLFPIGSYILDVNIIKKLYLI
jgi:hypothetical protein